MKLHEAIGTKLLNTAAIQALVSTRVYPVFAYQDSVTPLIIWSFRLEPRNDLRHELTNLASLTVDCLADDADTAVSVAYAVRDALHAYGVTWGTVTINRCTFRGMDVANVDGGDGTHIVAARMDFSLQYDGES